MLQNEKQGDGSQGHLTYFRVQRWLPRENVSFGESLTFLDLLLICRPVLYICSVLSNSLAKTFYW